MWNVYDKNGAIKEFRGNLYSICNGGYLSWPCLVCPVKVTTNKNLSLWSKWLEAVRKDIECFFGIMKKRFEILGAGSPVTLLKRWMIFFSLVALCTISFSSFNSEDRDYTTECDINASTVI